MKDNIFHNVDWELYFRYHICAGDDANEKDSCQGDSGGPLMVTEENGRLIKITCDVKELRLKSMLAW